MNVSNEFLTPRLKAINVSELKLTNTNAMLYHFSCPTVMTGSDVSVPAQMFILV